MWLRMCVIGNKGCMVALLADFLLFFLPSPPRCVSLILREVGSQCPLEDSSLTSHTHSWAKDLQIEWNHHCWFLNPCL